MPPVEPDAEIAGNERLTEQSLSAYLGGDESAHAVLSNTRVGVARSGEDGAHRIEPGNDYGAVAVLTDRRALFVVGDPDGDEAVSVPYVEFASVEARTETLARTLVVETAAGVRWEFTARESDALDDAMSHLAAALPDRFLRRAREQREVADATDPNERERRIEALEAAVEAFRRASTVVENPDVDAAATGEAAEAAIEDLIETHLERARNCRSVGNWSAEAGEAETALDHYEDACECFERALELARTYPPGDADAIAAEHEHLVEKCDAVDVTESVSSALD